MRTDLEDTLDAVEVLRDKDSTGADEKRHLNDFATVRMAGYLEQICFHAISGIIGEASDGNIQAFINSWFYKSPNLDRRNFRELFKRFGGDIDDRVKAFLEEDLNGDRLGTLLEVRNAIAHGKPSPASGRNTMEANRILVENIHSFVHDLLLSENSVISAGRS
ncbi:HEPN domain-containing protein [Brachybacterium avium]|uniref:HEPN domain-containing protein n=1 Tax=Brachybacterium avium TaxID=2017485 RepID=UPI0012FE6640|nr:HEPN domain-containing protein [Brachybacterium avium]